VTHTKKTHKIIILYFTRHWNYTILQGTMYKHKEWYKCINKISLISSNRWHLQRRHPQKNIYFTRFQTLSLTYLQITITKEGYAEFQIHHHQSYKLSLHEPNKERKSKTLTYPFSPSNNKQVFLLFFKIKKQKKIFSPSQFYMTP
jgi:hypothetical protein